MIKGAIRLGYCVASVTLIDNYSSIKKIKNIIMTMMNYHTHLLIRMLAI